MKTICSVTSVLAALALAVLPAKAQNLLTNGNFNTGDFTGWWTWTDTSSGATNAVLDNIAFSYDGTPYAYEMSRNGSSDSLIGQDVSGVPVGSLYQVSLEYRANNWGGAGVGIHYLDSSWNQLGYEWVGLYTGNGTDTDWMSFTSPEWTVPANTAYVEVRLDAWGWSDTYYDNVSLTEISVPEPATLALLSAGVILLVLQQRRTR
jgi:hypothetical protein